MAQITLAIVCCIGGPQLAPGVLMTYLPFSGTIMLTHEFLPQGDFDV
jgi:hypothetical protein